MRLSIQYNHVDAAFQEEVRLRALQEAGRELGFHLALNRYERDEWDLLAWLKAR